MIKEIKHNLSKPFKYAHKGEEIFAKHITMKSPTRHNLNDLSVLEGELFKSMMNSQKLLPPKSDNEKDKEIEKLNQIISDLKAGKKVDEKSEKVDLSNAGKLMAMGGADMSKCYKAFDRILLSENSQFKSALIDDKEPITDVILSLIDIKDYKSLFDKGGISLSEFLNMDLLTIFEFNNIALKMIEEEKRAYENAKRNSR
jgi:hypothetical protein